MCKNAILSLVMVGFSWFMLHFVIRLVAASDTTGTQSSRDLTQFVDTITHVANFAIMLFVALALLQMMVGAFLIVMSGGSITPQPVAERTPVDPAPLLVTEEPAPVTMSKSPVATAGSQEPDYLQKTYRGPVNS
jgi:hypothetical protein